MNWRNHTINWCGRVAVAIILVVVACGEDDTITVPPEKTVEELTATGWTEYSRGNLDEASTLFSEAILKDPDHVDAYLGDGWCRLGLATESNDFLTSLDRFNAVLSRTSSASEAHAGRAVVLLALGPDSLDAAIQAARTTLVLSPYFVLPHTPGFDFNDLLLVEAFAQVAQGLFTEALVAADRVEESGIREDGPETWVVDGVLLSSFNDAVLGHLLKLSNAESGQVSADR